MRRIFVLMLVALGFAAAALPADAGCSVRGRYCSYPTWAANAFERRAGRVVGDDHDGRGRYYYYRSSRRWR